MWTRASNCNEQHEVDSDEDELSFQAPKRESAEELLDASGGNPLDPMRHSAAHVMAEAVMDLFPGDEARHRAANRGRLLLRL